MRRRCAGRPAGGAAWPCLAFAVLGAFGPLHTASVQPARSLLTGVVRGGGSDSSRPPRAGRGVGAASNEGPDWRIRLMVEDGGYLGGYDMRQVAALRGEVAGESMLDEVTRAVFGNLLFQGGSTSYILASGRAGAAGAEPPLAPSPMAAVLVPLRNVSAKASLEAEASTREPVVACSQLGRLAIGGYIILRNDYLITSVLVREAWRRRGVGTALVQELLHRLPRRGLDSGRQIYHAWAFTGSDAGAAFLRAAGGEDRGTVWQLFFSDPLVALALLISSFAPTQLVAGARIFRFEALGDVGAYCPDGRLRRPQP